MSSLFIHDFHHFIFYFLISSPNPLWSIRKKCPSDLDSVSISYTLFHHFIYLILCIAFKGWHLPLCVWSWVTVLTPGWDDTAQTLQHLGWVRSAHPRYSSSALQILCSPELYHAGPLGTTFGQSPRYVLHSMDVDF